MSLLAASDPPPPPIPIPPPPPHTHTTTTTTPPTTPPPPTTPQSPSSLDPTPVQCTATWPPAASRASCWSPLEWVSAAPPACCLTGPAVLLQSLLFAQADAHQLPPARPPPPTSAGNMPDHVDSGWLPWLKEQRRKGVMVYLSSQCAVGPLHPRGRSICGRSMSGALSVGPARA